MNQIIKRLSSVRLTLVLLLALAALGGIGTLGIIPQHLEADQYLERFGSAGRLVLATGLDSFHTSIFYRVFFLFLLINLAACGYRRSVAGLKDAFGKGTPSESLDLADAAHAERTLSQAGFKVVSQSPLMAEKRRWAFLGFPLVHLAPIAIIAGALWGSMGGAICTENVYVGAITEAMYDSAAHERRTMPFAIELLDLKVHYYHPLKLKLNILLPDGTTQEVEDFEGATFKVKGTEYRAGVIQFNTDADDMLYFVQTSTQSFGPYSKGKEDGAPVKLRPVAFNGDTKRAEADVKIFDLGRRDLGRRLIAVNEPTEAMGYKIYLTGWFKDDDGKPYAGFQATKDPGEGLVWLGSVVMVLGLFLLLFTDGAWVSEVDGKLTGRSSRDRRAFSALLKKASGQPAAEENQ